MGMFGGAAPPIVTYNDAFADALECSAYDIEALIKEQGSGFHRKTVEHVVRMLRERAERVRAQKSHIELDQ